LTNLKKTLWEENNAQLENKNTDTYSKFDAELGYENKLVFLYTAGDRITIEETTNAEAAFISATVVDMNTDIGTYIIRCDNNSDGQLWEVDLHQGNHRPVEKFHYFPGTSLSVYFEGSWCDVHVRDHIVEGSLHLLFFETDSKERLVDLNPFNHCLLRLTFEEYMLVRGGYKSSIDVSVEDSITGNIIHDVRGQPAIQVEFDPVRHFSRRLESIDMKQLARGMLKPRARRSEGINWSGGNHQGAFVLLSSTAGTGKTWSIKQFLAEVVDYDEEEGQFVPILITAQELASFIQNEGMERQRYTNLIGFYIEKKIQDDSKRKMLLQSLESKRLIVAIDDVHDEADALLFSHACLDLRMIITTQSEAVCRNNFSSVWTFVKLKELTNAQRMCTLRNQVPDGLLFFENLQKYKRGDKMDLPFIDTWSHELRAERLELLETMASIPESLSLLLFLLSVSREEGTHMPLPETQADLYELAVNAASRRAFRAEDKDSSARLQDILGHIAFQNLMKGCREFTYDDVKNFVEDGTWDPRRFLKTWQKISNTRGLPFVKVIGNTPPGENHENFLSSYFGQYRFTHLSIQGSLAAKYFMGKIKVAQDGKYWDTQRKRISNEALEEGRFDDMLRLMGDDPKATTILFADKAFLASTITLDGWRRVFRLQARHPNLIYVKVSKGVFVGDIAELASCPTLEQVHLDGTSITGDIEALSSLQNLKVLLLGYTNVTGTFTGSIIRLISEMRSKYGKDSVSLNHCGEFNLASDLSDIADMTCVDLQCISSLQGNVGVFSNLPNIVELILYHTKIYGDIEQLSACTLLRDVHLNCTKVTGGVEALMDCTALKLVHLDYTDVSEYMTGANIQFISEMRAKHGQESFCINHCGEFSLSNEIAGIEDLTYIDLQSISSLQGDISVFQHCVNLKKLNLNYTKISGTITVAIICWISEMRAKYGKDSISLDHCGEFEEPEDLSGIADLPFIDLQCISSFEGTIDIFSSCYHVLRELTLSYTPFEGDIATLSKCKGLEVVNLDYSRITGSIKSFQECKALRVMNLQYTQVEGKIDVLALLPDLEVVCLDYTQVSGSIYHLTSCAALRELKLQSAHVKGDVGKLARCPALREVGLNYTGVFGNIEKLAVCGDLKKLSVCNTKVTGDIGVLPPRVFVQRNGSNVTGDRDSLNDELASLSLLINKPESPVKSSDDESFKSANGFETPEKTDNAEEPAKSNTNSPPKKKSLRKRAVRKVSKRLSAALKKVKKRSKK